MIKSVNAQLRIKYLYFTALIGLGFLWTGTAYIVQAYRMFGLMDGRTVNLFTMGVYYVCQAAGIGAVGMLFAKRAAFAGGRALPLCTTVLAFVCTAASLFIPSLTVIISAGALLNLAIGVLSGCYLTRLATNIPQERRGIVFGSAYAFGSLGTWLLSLPMGGRFLWHSQSFFAIAVPAALSLLLLRWLSPPPATEDGGYLHKIFKAKDIWLTAVVVFLLLMEQELGFAFPIKDAADGVYIEFTRIFYGAGLIIAGLVSDRNRRWGAICCLAALAFPFAALALGSNVAGETIMWVLAYLFLGFLSVYRILVFSDISGKSGLPAFAVLGLLAGRLGEAAGTLGAGMFTGTPLIILSGAVFVLVIGLFFLLYQKLYNTIASPEEAEQRRHMEYVSRFGLSAREQEIFSFIIQGMSNTEIANTLYITESTVKFHASNIFKKTGLGSRLALITDYKLGDKR
jgi:DNA-binding CsgD family transcriptional regulator/MFS family permease